jgi:hypothetical protein
LRTVGNPTGVKFSGGWYNSQVIAGEPGYEGLPLKDSTGARDIIANINPEVGKILDARLNKAGVIPAEYIQRVWPQVKDRILDDRETVDLSDFMPTGWTPKRPRATRNAAGLPLESAIVNCRVSRNLL